VLNVALPVYCGTRLTICMYGEVENPLYVEFVALAVTSKRRYFLSYVVLFVALFHVANGKTSCPVPLDVHPDPVPLSPVNVTPVEVPVFVS